MHSVQTREIMDGLPPLLRRTLAHVMNHSIFAKVIFRFSFAKVFENNVVTGDDLGYNWYGLLPWWWGHSGGKLGLRMQHICFGQNSMLLLMLVIGTYVGTHSKYLWAKGCLYI